MRVEPLQALALAVVGTVTGLAAAAWYWLGNPRRSHEPLHQ